MKIPTAVSGWLMLRRAGLTAEQRQLVQTNVGASMEETKIEEAMFSAVWTRLQADRE